MAGADTVLNLPYKAAGAITKQRFVTLTASETVKQADAAGQRALGVFQVDVSADEATKGKGGAVGTLGIYWVEASAAIALGAQVATTNNGRAVTAATTNVPLGIAMKAATGAGQLIPVLMTPGLPALP